MDLLAGLVAVPNGGAAGAALEVAGRLAAGRAGRRVGTCSIDTAIGLLLFRIFFFLFVTITNIHTFANAGPNKLLAVPLPGELGPVLPAVFAAVEHPRQLRGEDGTELLGHDGRQEFVTRMAPCLAGGEVPDGLLGREHRQGIGDDRR